MTGRHPTWLRNLVCIAGVALIVVGALAGCAQQPGGGQSSGPIKIGISLSLTGDFSSDGKGFQQGYQLWAAYVNAHGGLLGRQVSLDIVDDASSPQQVATNYQKLINIDKVDLVFGPYSTLLTKPSSVVANRYNYAFPEGAGGGPSVFTQGLHNVFDVSLPVINNLDTLADYINSLPAASRPQTAAYATEDDPFTEPQIDRVKGILEQDGVKTVYYKVYPAETTDYSPIALGIINSKADVVVAGTFLPDITSFVQHFSQQHYNPKILIGTSGPDEGSQFVKAIGAANTNGILTAQGWYPHLDAYQNAQFVQAFVAKYGGTADEVPADAAEGYSVGQVMDQAITKIKSLNNTDIINELHKDTFQSVQGPVQFDSTGQNIAAKAYLFQWQADGSYQLVFPTADATAPFEYPKANWGA